MSKILQWNIRGLQANREELDIILSHLQPSVICLQETFLKKNKIFTFKGYSCYHNYATEVNGVAHGGSSILVKSSTPHTQINLHTNLQAVAVRVTCHKTITVCSIYLPPSDVFNSTDFYDLLNQLPSPVLIVGDFNAHSTLWGCTKVDRRGKIIEDLITKSNLCILNNASTTYVHPATGSVSAIDLSMCSPDIFLDTHWETLDDLCGSDHYPIAIRFGDREPSSAAPTWKLHKADWVSFADQARDQLGLGNQGISVEQFTEKLTTIATETIPKSKFSIRKRNTVWFNDDCKEAVKNRNKALRKAKLSPTSENMQQYKIIRARTRKTIRKSRRQSWQKFVSCINSRTSIKRVWNMVNKISGKRSPTEVKHLHVGGQEVTTVTDIADTLAESFSSISSTSNYTPEFQLHKARTERHLLKFNSNNMEAYNIPFSMDELTHSLSGCNDSAAGPDDIHYQMLKHLPSESLYTLLNTLNDIWSTGNFPSSWRQSYIVSVPKPGKDTSDPTSYRPIALTSCVCKVMERMVNNRLVWYLERNKLITPIQSGFRKGRSTTDQLVRLESFIREAFVHRQHVTAIFFDLEKAYDTTWKFGILKDLHDAGLRGRLPLFIAGFLADRKFQVRVGGSYSKPCNQEMGVPQGSILSVTLFCLKINSIVKALCPGVEFSLYVDDFVICYRSKFIHIIERHLQRCLNKLQHWADTNGFKFSTSKTVCVHFCHLRKLHPDPQLLLYGNPIPVVEKVKFLGIIFDRKLSFLPHLHYLKNKCIKALNLLRVVAHTSWGADQQTILHLYRSLIRSKLDYGSIVYGSARQSYLKMLDPVQNQALRLCLGAFRTSPADSLCVEANEPPLHLRRNKLSVQYAVRVASHVSNPAREAIFNLKSKAQFDKNPTRVAPFGIRILHDLQQIGFNKQNLVLTRVPAKPPWLLQRPVINLDMLDLSKHNTCPDVLQSRFAEIRESLKYPVELFTDGSKMGSKVASAVVCQNWQKSTRLADYCSIFTAELHAIKMALVFIQRAKNLNFVVFSDSLSGLQSLSSSQIDNSLVLDILRSYTELTLRGKSIVLCWIPSHVGIKGNDKADTVAKAAINSNISSNKICTKDILPQISKLCLDKWQQNWNSCTNNKLNSIKPAIGETARSRLNRRDLVIINRLRIGHTRLTHSYLLTSDDRPECTACRCPLTVKHFLLECAEFSYIRRNYFTATSMKDLFDKTDNQLIVDFIKDINFYHSL